MMMRKVYTTPAYFTMLLLKFFNLLLIFLSRPYVARNRYRFGWFLGEPVVHSAEWTTGAGLFLVFALFLAFSRELVVHSTEWTTGAGPFLVFGLVLAFSWELVVHSMEWTTDAGLFTDFGLVSRLLREFPAMAATYLRGSACYCDELLEIISWLVNLAPLFIYYIDK